MFDPETGKHVERTANRNRTRMHKPNRETPSEHPKQENIQPTQNRYAQTNPRTPQSPKNNPSRTPPDIQGPKTPIQETRPGENNDPRNTHRHASAGQPRAADSHGSHPARTTTRCRCPWKPRWPEKTHTPAARGVARARVGSRHRRCTLRHEPLLASACVPRCAHAQSAGAHVYMRTPGAVRTLNEPCLPRRVKRLPRAAPLWPLTWSGQPAGGVCRSGLPDRQGRPSPQTGLGPAPRRMPGARPRGRALWRCPAWRSPRRGTAPPAPVPAATLATRARNANAAGPTRPNVSCDSGTNEQAPVPVRPYLSRFLVSAAVAAAVATASVCHKLQLVSSGTDLSQCRSTSMTKRVQIPGVHVPGAWSAAARYSAQDRKGPLEHAPRPVSMSTRTPAWAHRNSCLATSLTGRHTPYGSLGYST